MNLDLVSEKPLKCLPQLKEAGAKFTYCNRLIFWKKVSKIVCAGWTSTHAIETIISHYGSNLSATQVLKQMRKDKRSEDGYPRRVPARSTG
jgi:hypothetical protein